MTKTVYMLEVSVTSYLSPLGRIKGLLSCWLLLWLRKADKKKKNNVEYDQLEVVKNAQAASLSLY